MKKLIVLTIVACLLLPIGTIAYAEPSSEAESQDAPPIEEYAFNMTQDDIRDLLGVPHEEKENKVGIKSDEYFDVDYLDISGHLVFSYKDGKVDYVGWISPEIDESDIQKIAEAVEKFYDERYGTEEEVKYKDLSDDMFKAYSWADDFNKRNTFLYIYNFDGKQHVELGFSRQIKTK